MDRSKDSKLLSLRRQSPTPFSSDEGAESGDDSEEDLVTNYLPSSGSGHPIDTQHVHHHHHHIPRHHRQPPLVQQQHVGGVHPAHDHHGGGHGGAHVPRRMMRMAHLPTMDSMTAESLGVGLPSDAFIPPIPTISITPHSPIAHKPFTVLDENIRQLQGIQETIQRMRESTLIVNKQSGRALNRLSSSCPSLNVDEEELDDDDSPICSEEFLDSRKARGGSSSTGDCRRRSWSGLSDEEKKRQRQRSASLSSLDSDAEEAFYDAEDATTSHVGSERRGRVSEKTRSLSGSSSPAIYDGGGSSTHSLNDVHFQEKRASGPIEKPRLLAPRLTLQKSVSTPSILAGVQAQPQAQTITQSNYQYEDDHAATKRRKRGSSIFFRKKKDKTKKNSHQFVAVCYSNSATCDVCSKPMTNKPALRCETCQVCVHENSCKDQISDCSKLKNPKVIQKPGGNMGLSSSSKSASLGSYSTSGTSISSMGGHKSSSATVSRTRSAAAHSSSPTRPPSVSSPVPSMASAFPLDSKVNSDDKDHHDLLPSDVTDAGILGVNSASMESLDDEHDEQTSLDDINADPELRLLDSEEPELWVHTVDKEIVESLTEKQVKKQEHIYELIITEKHHCRMLKVMQKVFAEGMAKELGMAESRIKRIFPCLEELITIHCSFLWQLRQLQRNNKYIHTIGDLMVDQFIGDNAQGLKDAYGQFCSQHQEAVSYYKDILKTDRRFQNFIRQRSSHPLMKRKGIPECILFVTHRVTKYPLMLEAFIKYSKDQEEESQSLKNALSLVKEILVNINAQVAEKDREQKLLEIYHKIDAKSSATFKEQKFKKSDLLSGNRKLKFDGSAVANQQKGKSVIVQVIVLSDLVFFLLETNAKYYFFSPDTKQAAVIPLDKLIVREKAGQESRAIYLIYSKNTAEMFEFECSHPKDKKIWLDSIRCAIDECPDEDESGDAATEHSKLQEANNDKIRQLTGLMQHKDKELARVCEDKFQMVVELLEILGHEDLPVTPQYRAMLDEHQLDFQSARDLQITSISEALKLVSSSCGWGTSLARSVSSVGEHQSEAYVSPSLPKRAETFGGFDNPNKPEGPTPIPTKQGAKKKKDSRVSLSSMVEGEVSEGLKHRRPSNTNLTPRASQDNLSIVSTLSGDLTQQQQQQQQVAVKLVQNLQTALVLSQHHLTQYDVLRSKLSVGGVSVDGRFRHSQKLEELRNIQSTISHERAQWTKERDAQEKWISDKKVELAKLQDTLRLEQQDIQGQRELLYRKLEALKAQGIMLSPTLTVLTTTPSPQHDQSGGSSMTSSADSGHLTQGSPHSSPTSIMPVASRRSDQKHRNSTASLVKRDSSQSLPTHLISASNQQKISAAGISVKQQLPMKLAKLGSSGSTSGSSITGGASSPIQDRVSAVNHHQRANVSPSAATSVAQMLPLRLSQSTNEGDSSKGSRMTVGYQRLASPPPGNGHEAPSAPSHQRTGSSPATLQNGSPATSPSPVTTTASSTGGSRAARTNTYPKLSTRPNVQTNRSHTVGGVPVEIMNQLQQQSTEGSSSSSSTPVGSNTQRAAGSQSTQQPGQRVKDPDTNQDIIFF